MARYSCTALAGKVPLLAVFAVQCLVVAGAFIAVILTLTLQQEEDFTDTLYAQLQLRQQRTEKEILTPLVAEERSLDILAYQVALDPFARVILRDNVTSSDQIPDFFNMAQAVLNYSSRVAYIAQFQRSPNITISYNNVTQLRYTIAVSAAGGDTYMTKTPTEGLFTHPNIGQYYPLYNITTQTFGAVIPLNTMKTTWGFLDPTVTVRGKHEWSSPNVIADADGNLQLTQAYLSSIAHSPYIDTTERDSYITNGLGMVVDLTNVIPLVASSAVSPDSITCLVEMRRKSIMAGKLLFSAFDSVTSAPHTLPDSPDPILNEAFTETLQRCGDSTTCNSTVFVMGKGSDARLVSANRILTATKLDMMLIQYTNKAYFYDTFETNLIRGIIIGVCAAVVVVVSCFLIWLAIVRPLGRLQEQMGHAAVMRNQEAADAAEAEGGSMLKEMNQIHCSFVAMNNKLLQARPYLPQALLVADDTDSIDADDCEDEELQNMNESSITGSSLLRDGSTSGSIRGSVYTRNSVRSSVGTNARGGGTEHALAVSTTQRRIAILVVNASGFHRSARGMSSGETAKLVSTLVTAVEGAVRGERGIVDSFHGDHFTVSFNTARLVGTALRNAAVCALQVESAVRRQTPFKRVSMGLAGGRAMVGNMGNSSMMKLCALGPASGQATLLEMIAQSNLRQFGQETCCCLLSEPSAREIETYVSSHTAGWIMQVNRSKKILRGGRAKSPTSSHTPLVLNILSAVVSTKNEEWMYAITKESSSKKGGGVVVDDDVEVQRIADILSSYILSCIHHGMKVHRYTGSGVSGPGEIVSIDRHFSPVEEGLASIPDFSNTHTMGSRTTSILGNSTTNVTPVSTQFNSLRDKTLDAVGEMVSFIRQKYKEGCQRRLSSMGDSDTGIRVLGADADSEGFMGQHHDEASRSVHSDASLSGESVSPTMLAIGCVGGHNHSTSSPRIGGIITTTTDHLSGSVSDYCGPTSPGGCSNTTTPRLNTNGVRSLLTLQPLQLHNSKVVHNSTRRGFHFSSYGGLSHSERYILQSVDLLEYADSFKEVADALKLQVLSK